MLSSIEICAGFGGQALGLEMAGFHHVALVEYEKDYCDMLIKNRPYWNVLCEDVKNFSGLPFRGRDLFPEAIRLIGEIRPRAVMLENVRGFLSSSFDEYRTLILSQIEELGYNVQIKLLNACDFGVSQLRPRVIIVGIRKDIKKTFSYPSGNKAYTKTVSETLADLMGVNGWLGLDAWKKQASDIAPTIVGGSKKHGGPDLGPARARKAWAELGINGAGIADFPPEKDFIGMPKLTPRMIARIQGFPDDWKIAEKKTKACRMIGNAFPPPVAKAVGLEIRKVLEENE